MKVVRWETGGWVSTRLADTRARRQRRKEAHRPTMAMRREVLIDDVHDLMRPANMECVGEGPQHRWKPVNVRWGKALPSRAEVVAYVKATARSARVRRGRR